MGLKVSHGCFDGAYSSFMAFRIAIASAAIGRPVTRIQLYGEMTPTGEELIDMRFWLELMRDWPGLYLLMKHSDCDGVIPIEHHLKIANDLERAAEKLDASYAHATAQRALMFADGLRTAFCMGQSVVFE